MPWFPVESENPTGWRIQYMGLVTCLGAFAVDKHANAMVSSPFLYLPRIIPGAWVFPKCGLSRFQYRANPTLRAAACEARSEFPFVGRLPHQLHVIVPEMKDKKSFVPLSIHRWSIRKDGSAILGLALSSIHTILSSRAIRIRVRHYLIPESKRTFELVVKTPENAFWIIVCDKLAYNAMVEGAILLPIGEDSQDNRFLLPDLRRPKPPPTGVLLLSLSFIMFCNSTFICQVLITSAYIFLTALYSVIMPLGVCPGELKVATEYDSLSPTSHLPKPEERYTERIPTIARTVWYLIKLTNSTTWVRDIQAIPENPRWDQWLEEARKNIDSPDWPAEGEKRRLVDDEENVYISQELVQGSTNEEVLSITPVHESQW
ncbi:Ff.00g054020.m01.CDS01 [Fusarium sp. VM40]|nr:Ff.00g054020.m01.CDS01 [Fusarium sp. VM40]